MKRLILLRHSKTEPYSYDKNDFDRSLVEKGIVDCYAVSATLARKGYQIEHIFASPALRAKQTAKIFADNFDLSENKIEYKQEIYSGMTTQGLLNLFLRIPNDISTAMLVGHNPDISRCAIHLTDSLDYFLPTCGAVVLETEISEWARLGEQHFSLKDIIEP